VLLTKYNNLLVLLEKAQQNINELTTRIEALEGN